MPYLGYKSPGISSAEDDFLDLPANATHSRFDLNDGMIHVRAIQLSKHDAIGQAVSRPTPPSHHPHLPLTSLVSQPLTICYPLTI